MRAREGTAVARRYARALLDVATGSGEATRLRDELATAQSLLRAQPELEAAFAHPAVPLERKRGLAKRVFSAAQASPLLLRLVDLLAQRGRLGLLPAVADAYAAAWNEQQGIVRADVVTAVPLEAVTGQALASALAGVAGGSGVDLHPRVDPAVLGGVLVHMGGRTYDGTVRGRLRLLQERLSGRTPGGA